MYIPSSGYLHRHQHAGILVPGQQRILPVPRLSILDIRPAVHKVFMAHDLCQLARHGTIHVLNNVEVCWEKNIKVALVNLWNALIGDLWRNGVRLTNGVDTGTVCR